MAADSGIKRLQPAMNAGQINHAIKRANELNEGAWQLAEELGPDSKLFSKAERLWNRLLSFQLPKDPTDLEAFEHATFLAWWACWRARDYSWQRLERSIESGRKRQHWQEASRFFVTISNVRWPVSHIPFPYFNESEREQADSQLGRFGGHAIAHSFRHYADAFSEGTIVNRFQNHNQDVNWQQDWKPHWCYFDKPAQIQSNPQNCYSPKSAGDPRAKIESGSNSSVFLSPVELIRFDTAVGIKNSRFSAGIQIQQIRAKGTFQFPNSVETGAYVSFSGGPEGQQIKVENSPGIHAVRIANLKSAIVTILNQKLESLSLLHSPDARLARCSIEQAEIDKLTLNGQCADRLIAESCRFIECVETRNSVLDSIQLEDCEFLDSDCSFDGRSVNLQGKLVVTGCIFQGEVDLINSKMESLAFGSASSEKRNNFCRAFVAKATDASSTRGLGTIEVKKSDFFEEVTFENRTFRERTAFEDCVFHRAPRFQSCEFNFDTSFRRTTFDWKPFVLAAKGRERDDRLSVTEGSFRTLAKQMETIKAHDYQSKFHVEQMRARFMRKDAGEVPFWDRFFAGGYGLFAAFGSSFVLPFLWLIAVMLIATFGYFILGCCSGLPVSPQLVTSSVALALTLTFRPFFVFNPVFGRAGMDVCSDGEPVCGSTQLAAYLTQHSEISFKIAGLFHSIFATLFIFLILLALRRKFQLS